jgi:ABC-type nitrate/sulfonate/bicarbonate transport system substrate-binding protein
VIYRLASVFSLVLFFCRTPPIAAQNLMKIRIGSPAPSAVVAPIWIPKESGIYAKYGLDPEVIFFNSGGLSLITLIAGEVPIALSGGSDIVPAVLSGGPVVLVSSYAERIPLTLVTAAGIKTVSDLKNKKVAISRFGSNTDVAVRYLISQAGMDAQRDVTIVQVGGQSSRFAALTNGSVDATVIGPPSTLIARKLNLNSLVNLANTDLEFQYAGLATTKSYLKNRPDVVERFVKAFVEGIHFAKRNKERAMKYMAKHLQGSADELEESYNEMILKVVKVDPSISERGIKAVIEQTANRIPEAKNVKPDDLVNTEIINKLRRDGFTASLK